MKISAKTAVHVVTVRPVVLTTGSFGSVKMLTQRMNGIDLCPVILPVRGNKARSLFVLVVEHSSASAVADVSTVLVSVGARRDDRKIMV